MTMGIYNRLRNGFRGFKVSFVGGTLTAQPRKEGEFSFECDPVKSNATLQAILDLAANEIATIMTKHTYIGDPEGVPLEDDRFAEVINIIQNRVGVGESSFRFWKEVMYDRFGEPGCAVLVPKKSRVRRDVSGEGMRRVTEITTLQRMVGCTVKFEQYSPAITGQIYENMSDETVEMDRNKLVVLPFGKMENGVPCSPVDELLPVLNLAAMLETWKARKAAQGSREDVVFSVPDKMAPDKFDEVSAKINLFLEKGGPLSFNGNLEVDTLPDGVYGVIDKLDASCVKNIARRYSTPLPLAGEQVNVGSGVNESLYRQYYRDFIVPNIQDIYSGLQRGLEMNPQIAQLWLDTSSLFRSDIMAAAKVMNTMFPNSGPSKIGATPNEGRKLLGTKPLSPEREREVMDRAEGNA